MTDDQVAHIEDAPPPLPEGVAYGALFPRIEFPELTPPDCPVVWVEIRNPGMMPPAALEEAQASMKGVQVDDEGNPIDEDEAAPAVWAMLAKMIRRWHVYDMMADDDPLPELPSPPRTPEAVKQAPTSMLRKIIETVEALKAGPR